jgi:hypothetical protein
MYFDKQNFLDLRLTMPQLDELMGLATRLSDIKSDEASGPRSRPPSPPYVAATSLAIEFQLHMGI